MLVPLILPHLLLTAAATTSPQRRITGEPSIHLRRHLANGTTITSKPQALGESFIDALNRQIAPGRNGQVFTGGKGVLVRALLDGLSSTVVPATFIVNDMVTPSTVYPSSGGGNGTREAGGQHDVPQPQPYPSPPVMNIDARVCGRAGNPMCPNDAGTSGYSPGPNCPADSWGGNEYGPWNFAQIGAVVGGSMGNLMYKYDEIQHSDWGWGVFYPTDANAADQRCRYLANDNGWDCPGGWLGTDGSWTADGNKKGSGAYPAGNPYANPGWGGGTGCHFAAYKSTIDQTDAWDGQGNNLVSDNDCQCNYNLKGDGWNNWVKTWLNGATPKSGFEWQGWFGQGKAPSFALDFAACWVNNPRDMIELQNSLYWHREAWSNQLLPTSSWDNNDPASVRPYWGWNEVPVNGADMDNPGNWDAIFMKLPADICGGHKADSVFCLSNAAQQQLEADLDNYVKNKIIVPGKENVYKRPGAAVVWMTDQSQGYGWNIKFQRHFACEGWTSPNKKYAVVMGENGTCYLDWGGGVMTV